jgi:hypothetical protein
MSPPPIPVTDVSHPAGPWHGLADLGAGGTPVTVKAGRDGAYAGTIDAATGKSR